MVLSLLTDFAIPTVLAIIGWRGLITWKKQKKFDIISDLREALDSLGNAFAFIRRKYRPEFAPGDPANSELYGKMMSLVDDTYKRYRHNEFRAKPLLNEKQFREIFGAINACLQKFFLALNEYFLMQERKPTGEEDLDKIEEYHKILIAPLHNDDFGDELEKSFNAATDWLEKEIRKLR